MAARNGATRSPAPRRLNEAPAVLVVFLVLAVWIAPTYASSSSSSSVKGSDEVARAGGGRQTEPASANQIDFGYQSNQRVGGAIKGVAFGGGSDGDVRKQWGLADTTATVGKPFCYHIPSDAFAGDIHHYEVRQTTADSLPSWIYFNNASTTLVGVPTVQDVGQFYMVVRAVGTPSQSGETKFAQDVFHVNVLSASRGSDKKAMLLKELENPTDPVACAPTEDSTTMSILLDGDLKEMDPLQRIQLYNKMLDHLSLSEDNLRLFPSETSRSPVDGNTIMAGPGDALRTKKEGLFLQWQVGCANHVSEANEALVNSIEKCARDGSLSAVLGVPVVGWLLTSSPPLGGHRRQRRQASYGGGHSTPTPGLMPTRHPSVTETIRESYPDPEENEHHGRSGGARLAATDDEDDYDEGPTPDIRIIPTMASPSFGQHATAAPVDSSSSSHRHRHHHELGTHTRGSGGSQQLHHFRPNAHYEEPSLTASPTFHYLKGTPVLGTPSPTPVLHVPIRPTQPTYYDPEETDAGRVLPSEMPDRAGSPDSTDPVVVSSSSTRTHTPEEIAPTRASDLPSIVTTTTATMASGAPRSNFRPVIRNRVQKLAFIAGKVSRFAVPPNTFFDFEDGESPKLKLMLTNTNGSALQSASWIQFDGSRQEIYALPLEQNIGKWEFVLEAMDGEGASVRETVDISVRQHAASRAVHHEFVMQLKYDRWRFGANIDWQIRLMDKLAAFFDDRSDQHIVVRSVTTEPNVIFTWTNDTLPPHPCPQERIQELLHAMVSSREGSASKQLRKVVAPEFKVLRVTVNMLGHCRAKVPPTPTTHTNERPSIRNHIDHINATAGEYLHFRVPDDTFYDAEDGNVRNLRLTFLTIDGGEVPRSLWIQFDAATQEFNGLPMDDDVGHRQYQLVAVDKEGLSATDALVVAVQRRPPHRRPSVEFSVRLENDFNAFNSDLTKKVMVLDKLAHLYGDPDPRYVTVQSITRGSVVFAWSNNTLPSDPCPKEQIVRLVKVLFNDNGTVSRRLLDAFRPEFNVSAANVMPLDTCLADITPTSISVGPTSTVETEKATSDDDVYVTTVIPAVVIAAMLLIAAIIACALYRKKRKGKMSMEDNHNNGTFVNKGIPIIFADELEEKSGGMGGGMGGGGHGMPHAKSPVIMREEKPPMPPPEYPSRSSRSGSPSPPPPSSMHHLDRANNRRPPEFDRRLLDDRDDLDHLENSPPYQPPPPFTANRDSRLSRPKHTPTYRQPPPYVPP